MGAFGCCRSGFKALSRAAAQSAAAKLRQIGVLPIQINWTARAELCARCPLQVSHRGVSYCGKPFTYQIHRAALDGCGCPTLQKSKAPREHCPITVANQPADHEVCDCKWCTSKV